jgi:hypothetical protein
MLRQSGLSLFPYQKRHTKEKRGMILITPRYLQFSIFDFRAYLANDR